jgi:SAM-dependent methyltransferase
MAESSYLHGVAKDEQRRLSRLNDLLNEPVLRELRLIGGERVLDFGSGLGQLTRAIARQTGPSGRVIGIERSKEQIAEAFRQAAADGEISLAEFREGNVLDPPLRADEWGTFDVVHARFLLEHVPNPAAVVRQMARAARPGGRVVLEDDDHGILRLWPEPPGLAAIWQAYIQTYEAIGNDPFIGRKLTALLYAGGLRPLRNTWLFFGASSGDDRLGDYVDNLIGIFDGAREHILVQLQKVANEQINVCARYFDQAIEAFREWKTRSDVALWYAVCWAEASKPPAADRK